MVFRWYSYGVWKEDGARRTRKFFILKKKIFCIPLVWYLEKRWYADGTCKKRWYEYGLQMMLREKMVLVKHKIERKRKEKFLYPTRKKDGMN